MDLTSKQQAIRVDAIQPQANLPASEPRVSPLVRAGQAATSCLSRGARAVADLLVPPVCLVCEGSLAGHDALCGPCWRQVDFVRAPLCDRTGRPMPFDTGGVMVSAEALANPPAYDRARFVARHDGVMKDLVHGFKYADRLDARNLFGRWLALAGKPLLPDTHLILPVPLHRAKLFSRRYNQAALLGQELARITKIYCDPMALTRIRPTESQVGKTANQRRRNVSGAFAVHSRRLNRIRGRNLLLIDDVITTGATAEACCRVLRSAGAARIDVLALARTDNPVTITG